MIHYHGTPITPIDVLYTLRGRNFCVSYESPAQTRRIVEQAQSVMFDNGAFSVWRRGAVPDWDGFYDFVEKWMGPADWAVIPDVINGDDLANDELILQWPHGQRGAPVWHMHESIGRLEKLVDRWPLVCFGSTDKYGDPLSDPWRRRADQAFNVICKGRRFVPRIHGMRMMACSGRQWPFASVDSADVARNHNRPNNVAKSMVERWDTMQCPSQWKQSAEQPDFFETAS